MAKLTREKIGKLLEAHNIGNISSLISIKSNKEKIGNHVREESVNSRLLRNKEEKNTTGSKNASVSVLSDSKVEKPKSKKEKVNINFQTKEYESVSDPLADQNIVSSPLANDNDGSLHREILDSFQQFTEWATIVTGKEYDLLAYLIGLCEKECNLRTPPVLSKDLIELLSINATHLRNLIFRLTEKKLLKVVLHRSGKHALRVFEFEKDIYTLLVTRKNKHVNNTRSPAQSIQNREDFESNNTEVNQAEYLNIDIGPMEQYGFNISNLIQIFREYKLNPDVKLNNEIVQDSINAMAFDVKYNEASKDFKYSPAVVLTSLLKKGKPYSSKTPEKFVSPQIEATRKYVEWKTQENKLKESLQNQSKELALQEWQGNLTESELMEFYIEDRDISNVPEKVQKTLKRRNAMNNARQYFENEIWPKKKKEIEEMSSL